MANRQEFVTKLVLDTNVVIDWLVFDDPFMDPLRAGVESGRVIVITHALAVDELQRVLTYPELKIDPPRQQWILDRYAMQTSRWPAPQSISTEPLALPKGFPVCRDPDDNHFLALTYVAQAAALVSRDNAVLRLKRRATRFGFDILNVQEMIGRLVSTP